MADSLIKSNHIRPSDSGCQPTCSQHGMASKSTTRTVILVAAKARPKTNPPAGGWLFICCFYRASVSSVSSHVSQLLFLLASSFYSSSPFFIIIFIAIVFSPHQPIGILPIFSADPHCRVNLVAISSSGLTRRHTHR